MEVKLLDVTESGDEATMVDPHRHPLCDGCGQAAEDRMTLVRWGRQWNLLHNRHRCRWLLLQRVGLEYYPNRNLNWD